jgi:phage tail P2-like protein
MSNNEFNLLPPNASADDQKNAKFLVDGLEREVNLSTLPLEAHASLLPHLAIAYGVDISGLTDGEAREYLNNAFEIHRHKGTVYAVKKAIAVMFGDAELKEWFDNDLTAGLFDVEVVIDPDPSKVYSSKRFSTAKRLIDDAKNVRCHLNIFNVRMPPITATVAVGTLKSPVILHPYLDINEVILGEITGVSGGWIFDPTLQTNINESVTLSDTNLIGGYQWQLEV